MIELLNILFSRFVLFIMIFSEFSLVSVLVLFFVYVKL